VSQPLDYVSQPPPSPLSKLPLMLAVAGIVLAAGSAILSSLFWRRVFDQSPDGGRYDEAALLELALSLGGIVCGSIALGTGLYRRQTLVPLMGLLALVVSLASAGVCGTSQWPRTYVPL